ncbi:hypothetical protein pb186bvf_003499 [Paramecium bursaria]
MKFVSGRELEQLAASRVDKAAFDYYQTGANEELTKQENINAFKRIKLHPRVLRDVSVIDTKTKILGYTIDLPIGVAPTAMMKLAHPRGELIPAEVCGKYNIPYTVSTLSTQSLSDIRSINQNGIRFFQLYIQKQLYSNIFQRSKEATLALVREAEENGYHALVITIDTPVIGKREAEERNINQFSLPSGAKLEVLEKICKKLNIEIKNEADLLKFRQDQKDASTNWNTIKYLQKETKLPIVLKGIMCAEDALTAKRLGVNAIWVSNHGGRQLDTVRATIDVLPEIIQAVGKDYEVYIDGGIRQGTDIIKCLALGARCVFIGRPVFYSIVIEENGFEKLIALLKAELIKAMQLLGVTKIPELTKDYLVPKL